MKERKKLKKTLLVLLISIFTVLGSTVAYFTTQKDVINYLKAAIYGHQIIDTFASSDDWLPGQSLEKEISIKNNGNSDMAVRIYVNEYWQNANENDLPLTDDEGNSIAVLEFNDDWAFCEEDGFYYYGTKSKKTALKPDNKTSSLLNKITLNENVKVDLVETVSEDGTTINYVSSGNGYDGATYNLQFKIETIQYNLADAIWK